MSRFSFCSLFLFHVCYVIPFSSHVILPCVTFSDVSCCHWFIVAPCLVVSVYLSPHVCPVSLSSIDCFMKYCRPVDGLVFSSMPLFYVWSRFVKVALGFSLQLASRGFITMELVQKKKTLLEPWFFSFIEERLLNKNTRQLIMWLPLTELLTESCSFGGFGEAQHTHPGLQQL